MLAKAPDEIKKGLECCGKGLTWDETSGTGCPYQGMYITGCAMKISADALALIQQLQDDNAEKDVRIQQLEAERDAAVNELRLVQEKYEEAVAVIDDDVFPLVDYDVYCRLRYAVDDMMSWEVESDSRGVQKEE